MPKLPQPTAEGRQAILSLPQPSAEQLGAGAARQLSEFGRELGDIGEKIQAQQDETALIQKTSAYNERLAEIPQEILDDPSIEPGQRYKQFIVKAKEHRRTLEAGASPAVVRALGNHEEQSLSRALIQFQHDSTAEQIQQARVGVHNTQGLLAQREAFAMANRDTAGVNEARQLREDALARATTRGIFNPIEAQAMHEKMNNDKFELVAQQNPGLMIEMTDQVKAGKPSEQGMDPTKAVYYGNLAYNELHRRELILQADETRRAATQESQALQAKQDYYQRFTEGKESLDQLVTEAGRDMVLSNHKDEVVTFLTSMKHHAQSSAGQQIDYGFYNRTILPNIYNGTYRTEQDVLHAGADKLGSHMGTAISAFQTYRSSVNTKIIQDYDFGKNIITRTFAPLPGQQIDPLGVQQAGARASDRFNTWYTSLVDRAKTEGPRAFDGVDIQAEARKIKDQEYQTLQDNIITILDTTESTLRYKTVGDIEKARADHEISARQANMYLSQLETYESMKAISAKKTVATPSAGGRIEKK